ncbi:hypothetical protein B0T14DRAFT_434266, partial [Immersiella caudata]
GSLDGVVMRERRMFGKGSTTLIHEVGHWLGLNYPFGKVVETKAEDCKIADGLLKTSHLSGMKNTVNECSQVRFLPGDTCAMLTPCTYSSCRGGETDLEFTTDQKTAMFVRYTKFQNGFKAGDCVPRDPKRDDVTKKPVNKRSAMQDLIDGKCPDIEAPVSIFLSQPTATPSKDAAVSVHGGISILGTVGTMAAVMVVMLV